MINLRDTSWSPSLALLSSPSSQLASTYLTGQTLARCSIDGGRTPTHGHHLNLRMLLDHLLPNSSTAHPRRNHPLAVPSTSSPESADSSSSSTSSRPLPRLRPRTGEVVPFLALAAGVDSQSHVGRMPSYAMHANRGLQQRSAMVETEGTGQQISVNLHLSRSARRSVQGTNSGVSMGGRRS